MQGGMRKLPQAPHTHMQSCTCARREHTGEHTLPSGAPGRPGQDSKPGACPPQGEGTSLAASGMDRRPRPLYPVQGALGSDEGQGGAWARPWPARPCLPLSSLSQERPGAYLRPLRGKEATGGPTSARSRAFPGRMLWLWPPQGARQASPVGVQGEGCGLSVHTAGACLRPPWGPLHSSAGPARRPRAQP